MTPSKRSSKVPVPRALHGGRRNPCVELRLDWVEELRVEGREPEAPATGHGDDASRLLRVVGLLDLTSLADEDTDETIRELCSAAVRPIADELLEALSVGGDPPKAAAVCVFDRFVPVARAALEGAGVRVAAVTAGFPTPHTSLSRRLADVRAAVDAGADEIDLVIDRDKAVEADWRALYDEVRSLRDACGPALLKTILVAGHLGAMETVAKTGLVCCLAGADFVKTSTGRETVNATPAIGRAMTAAIRLYAFRAGYAVGLKPAGGIRAAADALAWLDLVREELGDGWAHASTFRIGASSLLPRIVERLGALRDIAS